MTRRFRTLAAGALISALVLVVASLTALVGCSSGGGSSDDGSPAVSPAAGSLDGTRWLLNGWSVSSLDPADFTITADFVEGQISGNSGINSYSGPYTSGPGDAFSTGPLASTMMAGPEPAMRAEAAYAKLLSEVVSYLVTPETLLLNDAGGNESLVFAAAGK
jgi:heat shock protein HslJ